MIPTTGDVILVKPAPSLSVQPIEQSVCRYLGYQPPASESIPTAYCHHWCDFGTAPDENLVAAVPIHIAVDSDHGRLTLIDVSAAEAKQIQQTLNQFLAEDGTQLSFTSPERWYLHGCAMESIKQLDSLPAPVLAGRNVGHFLPRLEGAASWRRLLTEVQMALHDHPVNTARSGQQLSINGFWFWGAFSLDSTPIERSIEPAAVNLVFANDAFTRGLCRAAGIACRALSELDGADDLSTHASLCVVNDDQAESCQQLLLQKLQLREVGSLTIDDGVVVQKERVTKPWWRRWL
ncbi:MAG: hypothetical protein KTR35_01875 [Gammaproteobacteria bacterium]|nr:hypothetical protein [Gammaproteobacteria bacterium]